MYQKANAAGASFRLSPAEGNFCQSQIFEIEVRLGTGGANTNAAEFYIYYDPSMLEVVDANPGRGGIQIHEGDVYDNYIDNSADPSKGEIRLTGFSAGNPYNSGAGSGLFARIPFRGLRSGETEVKFGFTPGSTTDSNVVETGTSIDILGEVRDGVYTINKDEAAPYVQARRPDKDQRNVPIDTSVNFEIKDDCSGTDINNLKVKIDGIEYTASGSNRFMYAGTQNSYQIGIRPVNVFREDYEVKVKINANDFAGNRAEDNYSFFTGRALGAPYTLLWNPDKFSIGNKADTDISFRIKDDREGVDINTIEVLINGVPYKKSGENSFEYSGDPFEYTIKIDPDDLLSGVVMVVINGCDLGGVCMSPDSYWFAIIGAEVIYPECPPCEPLVEKIPGVGKIIDKIKELRKNEAAKNIIKKVLEPILSTSAVLSLLPLFLSSLPVFLSQIPYFFLRFLYLFLALFGLKKRGKPWGIVFDSYTKKPIKNAIVRIYDLEFNKLKETQLTDSLGRFGFFAPPGEYYVKVVKPGYIFPSKVSAAVYQGASVICYQGGKIVRLRGEAVAINIYIPLDPEVKEIHPTRSFVVRALHYVQVFLEWINYPIIIFGTAFSLFVLLVLPTALNGVVFGVYTLLLILKIIMTFYTRESFGIVLDKETGKPVDLAIVRLFKEGQLVRTAITGISGQFNFLVLPGNYYLTIGKAGYGPHQSETIEVKKKEGTIKIKVFLIKI